MTTLDMLGRVIHCPYCAEANEILIDPSIPEQEYIEDCQVCCRPMTLKVSVGGDSTGGVAITALDENEY